MKKLFLLFFLTTFFFSCKDQIAEEWDRLAQLRCEQIESGKDLSFANVLLPMVMRLSQDLDHSNVLDVGCGVGFVTREIARRSQNVVGIDISKASIEHARKRTGSIRNVQFFHSSVEQFSVGQEQESFTCAVSNMMLMIPSMPVVKR